MQRRSFIAGLTAAGAAASAWPLIARAQGSAASAADVAAMSGPDRTERLIAGAKKEATVSLYSSATVEDIGALIEAFEKKYGFAVRIWRGSSEDILKRVVTEARGGRFDADVFETGALTMEALHREKLLQPLTVTADLAPAAILPHREWTGTRFNVFAAAYNTKLVQKSELPKSYDDLLDPRWKGRLGIEADDGDWFGTLAETMGEERARTLFRGIVAANGISVRKGHTLLANLVLAGEVPFALTTYAYKVEQLKKAGAPIDWFVIPPGLARFEGGGVARRAPHPYAAVLFLEYLLTDGQKILLERDFFPALRDAKPLPVPLRFIDAAKALDQNQTWNNLYRDVVLRPAK